MLAKEPWQMTYVAVREELGRLETGTADQWRRSPVVQQLFPEGSVGRVDYTALSRLHKASIAQALSEGKPVPAEVLADYPELAREGAQVMPEYEKRVFDWKHPENNVCVRCGITEAESDKLAPVPTGIDHPKYAYTKSFYIGGAADSRDPGVIMCPRCHREEGLESLFALMGAQKKIIGAVSEYERRR